MITRYRGDTHPLKIRLENSGFNVDLSTVTKVEMGIAKGETVIIVNCRKDTELTSGIVYAEFTPTDLDAVGTFSFDVQVTWLDGTKTTFLVDKIRILPDVNKT